MNLVIYQKKEEISKLNADDTKQTEYCLERISNLNSFYYVRVDNGFLAPFIAWLVVSVFMDRDISCIWILTAIIIGAITASYLKRISFEIKAYRKIIEGEVEATTK